MILLWFDKDYNIKRFEEINESAKNFGFFIK